MAEKKVSQMIEEAAKDMWENGLPMETAVMTPLMARKLSGEFGKMIQPRTTVNDEGRIVVLPDNHPSSQAVSR